MKQRRNEIRRIALIARQLGCGPISAENMAEMLREQGISVKRASVQRDYQQMGIQTGRTRWERAAKAEQQRELQPTLALDSNC